jgi:hypothetical protein
MPRSPLTPEEYAAALRATSFARYGYGTSPTDL